MSWDERQRLMLAEMGLRVWSPLPAAVKLAAEAIEVSQPVSAPPPHVPALPIAAAQALPAALRPSAPAAAPGVSHRPADLPARLPAIARMDWDELRHSAAECRACALCGGRSNSVFGAGQTSAQWLVVGEAPGEQEDAQGEPFAGQTAQLLVNMLRAIDLSADASPAAAVPAQRLVYLSSALKCRPAPGSTPGPDELQQCRPYLERQIELLKPRIILAMGRLAVQALLGSNEPLGRLRGRVHDYQGTPVIATFAPSYLLRNLAEKARAWEDLCLARATLQARGP
ncbi:uracil-DNA glycosylase [Roseateles oligotrophus]|uniref:Type-4 uracil-DNA glycosylase n=1 Tax=Roseateles oligotrophus TaxID=1769250 RepID=A0ABT2YHL3_9BURK|nr:uracil-DNA glycosylase [Roseateles oligotrophus]MCV2369543.1 uracil-DNA glycosylase [Roseateles oligotrophus]